MQRHYLKRFINGAHQSDHSCLKWQPRVYVSGSGPCGQPIAITNHGERARDQSASGHVCRWRALPMTKHQGVEKNATHVGSASLAALQSLT
jgi:hypothetical protein